MNNLFLSHFIPTFSCSKCLNYLSIGPVAMTKNKKIICGRCFSKSSTPCYPSFYNHAVKFCYFRCKNFYSGCQKLLYFNCEHENFCLDKNFSCPACCFRGNGVQLVHHVEEFHSERLIETGKFEVSIEYGFNEVYFNVGPNYLLAIHVEVTKCCILIGVVDVCNNPQLSTYYLKLGQGNNYSALFTFEQPFLKSCDSDNFYKIKFIDICGYFHWSKPLICEFMTTKRIEKYYESVLEKDLQLTSMENEILRKQAEINERLDIVNSKERTLAAYTDGWLEKFVTITASLLLQCFDCKKTTKNVYLCPKQHTKCSSCLNSFCYKCNSICSWISPQDIFDNIRVACTWPGCKKMFAFNNYLFHKQKCEFRQYKCPALGCNFEGIFYDLKNHWHTVRPALITEESIIISLKESWEVYWLSSINCELLRVKILENDQIFKLEIDESQALLPESYYIVLVKLNGEEIPFVKTCNSREFFIFPCENTGVLKLIIKP